jgi:hypothetical protein
MEKTQHLAIDSFYVLSCDWFAVVLFATGGGGGGGGEGEVESDRCFVHVGVAVLSLFGVCISSWLCLLCFPPRYFWLLLGCTLLLYTTIFSTILIFKFYSIII